VELDEELELTRVSSGWDMTFPCKGRVLKKASVRLEPKVEAAKHEWQLEQHEIVRVERDDYDGELQFVYVQLLKKVDSRGSSGWVKVSTSGFAGMGGSPVLSFYNDRD
jgi:hypothetical protein